MRITTAPIEPEGEVYVIGDVHGCYDTLIKLLKKINFSSTDCLYFTGDLIDRGSDSKRVVDLAMSLERKRQAKIMRGNHEQMLLDSLESPKSEEHWVSRSGGKETLESFGVDRVHDIPEKYLSWFRRRPATVQLEYDDGITYVVSHAGVNLGHDRPFRNTETNVNHILWNRDKHKPKKGIVNIVGHTPKSVAQCKKTVDKGTVYIDAGCIFGGYLVAFDPNTHDMFVQKNVEKVQYRF